MPLVIICGLPCSGKTSRARQLKEHLEQEHGKTVHVVGDDDSGQDKNAVYAETRSEKDCRASLKSAVQRLIAKDSVVILDSMNYIKGYRYELYCVTKLAQTPHCVVWCDASQDKALAWNSERPESERYDEDLLKQLCMRFEAPVGRNRWDSPLFVVQAEDELPLKDVYGALFLRKAPPPNQSTQCQPLASKDFLYELDRITREIVTSIQKSQNNSQPGDFIPLPSATEKYRFVHVVGPGELQRTRRAFLAYSKTRNIEDVGLIPNMFVQYLNQTLNM